MRSFLLVSVLLPSLATAAPWEPPSSAWPNDGLVQACPEQIASGGHFSCVLHDNGDLACFGWNPDGRTDAPTSGEWTDVSAGEDFGCAIDWFGEISCWGANAYGQTSSPPGEAWVRVEAGAHHACALSWTGAIECWGADWAGAVSGAPSGSGYIAVSSGYAHSCAVNASGQAECWGWNHADQADPNSAFGPNQDWVDVSAGTLHTCGLRANGSAECWGSDAYGAFGGVAYDQDNVHIDAGHLEQCTIVANGNAGCFGKSTNWAPGVASDISAGTTHACAIVGDSVVCGGQTGMLGPYVAPKGTTCGSGIEAVEGGASPGKGLSWPVSGGW